MIYSIKFIQAQQFYIQELNPVKHKGMDEWTVEIEDPWREGEIIEVYVEDLFFEFQEDREEFFKLLDVMDII